jgi:radical SAM protein with 4Fe4S-binding SPASM domain
MLRRKMNSLARRISMRVAPAYPVFAWITPTTRCNLKCITCARTLDPNWKSMDMDPEVYEIVRKEILPGLIAVEITGTGEPFLAPDFPTMLDDVIGQKIEFSVTTNLTVLPDDNVLQRMVNARGSLMISIDGTMESTLTRIRPGLNYDVFMRNMRHVANLVKESNNPDFTLKFNFVITQSNLGEMIDLIELARQYGVTTIVFSSFLVGNRDDEFTSESLFDKPMMVQPHLKRAKKLADRCGITLQLPVFKSQPGKAMTIDPVGELDNKKALDLRIGQCPYPWWGVYVDVDGSVMPCCVFGVPFGNLKEKSFKQIWNGPVYRHFRSLVNTPDMPEGCRHCPLDVRI